MREIWPRTLSYYHRGGGGLRQMREARVTGYDDPSLTLSRHSSTLVACIERTGTPILGCIVVCNTFAVTMMTCLPTSTDQDDDGLASGIDQEEEHTRQRQRTRIIGASLNVGRERVNLHRADTMTGAGSITSHIKPLNPVHAFDQSGLIHFRCSLCVCVHRSRRS